MLCSDLTALPHLSWLHPSIHSLMVAWKKSLLTCGSCLSGSSRCRRSASLPCSGLWAVIVCRYCMTVETSTTPDDNRKEGGKVSCVYVSQFWGAYPKAVYLGWRYDTHHTWCQGVHAQRIHWFLYCPRSCALSHSRVTPTLHMCEVNTHSHIEMIHVKQVNMQDVIV